MRSSGPFLRTAFAYCLKMFVFTSMRIPAVVRHILPMNMKYCWLIVLDMCWGLNKHSWGFFDDIARSCTFMSENRSVNIRTHCSWNRKNFVLLLHSTTGWIILWEEKGEILLRHQFSIANRWVRYQPLQPAVSIYRGRCLDAKSDCYSACNSESNGEWIGNDFHLISIARRTVEKKNWEIDWTNDRIDEETHLQYVDDNVPVPHFAIFIHQHIRVA